MTKLLGSLLAGLIVVQGALPSLGLDQPVSNGVAVLVTAVVAGLTYYLRDTTKAT